MNSLRELNGTARVDAVARLIAALPDCFPERSIYIDAANHWPVFAMQDGETLRGAVILRPHGYVSSEIFFMAVMPEAQSRGTGTALLSHAITVARQQERTSLVTWTSHANSPFWLKHGFAYMCDAHQPDQQLALYVKAL